MGLQLEVATLDGVEESQKSLYVEKDGKFRLAIDGLDDAVAGKDALLKEREARKQAKTEAEQLRQALEAKQLEELESQKKYEELYKREQENRTKTAAELQELKNSIAQREKSEAALKVASSLTRDTAKAELLAKEAGNYLQNTPEGLKIIDNAGNEIDAGRLSQLLATKYPFLADGNQASGGGASGSSARGAGSVGNLGGTKNERTAAITSMFPDLKG